MLVGRRFKGAVDYVTLGYVSRAGYSYRRHYFLLKSSYNSFENHDDFSLSTFPCFKWPSKMAVPEGAA